MSNRIVHEITPLLEYDCFTVAYRQKKAFDFPVHFHEEFELNLLINAVGAKRIIGKHSAEISAFELVMVGSNLPHGWTLDTPLAHDFNEITIQFHHDLLTDNFLSRNQMRAIRTLLEKAASGIIFSEKTIREILPNLVGLTQKVGFDSIMELLYILHYLSQATDSKYIEPITMPAVKLPYNAQKVGQIFAFIHHNFTRKITIKEIAQLVNMTESAFSRLIKTHTGDTFNNCLNNIRIGHVTRMLVETEGDIAQIAYQCGFNNIAYFNRTFKSRKGCTPKEYKQNYTGERVFI
jgi:AraC-like DNA-binding protein